MATQVSSMMTLLNLSDCILKEIWVHGKEETFVLRDGPFCLRIKALNGVIETHAAKKIRAAIVKPLEDKAKREAEATVGKKCYHIRMLIVNEMRAMRFLGAEKATVECSDVLGRLAKGPMNIALHEMERDRLELIFKEERAKAKIGM